MASLHNPTTCRCSCHQGSPQAYSRPLPASQKPLRPTDAPAPAPSGLATPRLSERAIEAYLDKKVRIKGGATYKFAPLVAGNPDRIVLIPHGPIHLVELKAPDGAVRPDQALWHARARKIGHYVHILSSKSDVDDFVRWAVRHASKTRTPARPPAYDQQDPDAFDEVMSR